jgi:hypothetical protein
MSFQDA